MTGHATLPGSPSHSRVTAGTTHTWVARSARITGGTTHTWVACSARVAADTAHTCLT